MTAQLVFEVIDVNREFILCIFVIPMIPLFATWLCIRSSRGTVKCRFLVLTQGCQWNFFMRDFGFSVFKGLEMIQV